MTRKCFFFKITTFNWYLNFTVSTAIMILFHIRNKKTSPTIIQLYKFQIQHCSVSNKPWRHNQHHIKTWMHFRFHSELQMLTYFNTHTKNYLQMLFLFESRSRLLTYVQFLHIYLWFHFLTKNLTNFFFFTLFFVN